LNESASRQGETNWNSEQRGKLGGFTKDHEQNWKNGGLWNIGGPKPGKNR
jgi:hypothetical protein